MKQWIQFFLAVLRYGRLFQPLRLDKEKLKGISPFKLILLKTPVICQLISLMALYRFNKKEPYVIYHLHDKKLAFVSINKNASTSILTALTKVNNDDSDQTTDQFHQEVKKQMQSDIHKGYHSFAVVREPKDRLLSCYYDLLIDRDRVGYFEHLYFGLLRSDLRFDQFVKRVAKIPDSVKEQHIKCQTHCLPKHSDIQIFKFENLNEELVPFLQKHGITLEWKNRGEGKKNDPIHKSTESLIRAIYQEDYQAFGY